MAISKQIRAVINGMSMSMNLFLNLNPPRHRPSLLVILLRTNASATLKMDSLAE